MNTNTEEKTYPTMEEAELLHKWGFVVIPLSGTQEIEESKLRFPNDPSRWKNYKNPKDVAWQYKGYDDFNRYEFGIDNRNMGITAGPKILTFEHNGNTYTKRGSGIFIVDIDNPKPGVGDGKEFFAKQLEKFGPINTFTVMTGGGYHYYFEYEDRFDCFSNVSKCISLNGSKLSVDIRTKAGFAVAPFSYHCDAKRRYEIVNGFDDETPQIRKMPEWLYEQLKQVKLTDLWLEDQERRIKGLPPRVIEKETPEKEADNITNLINKTLQQSISRKREAPKQTPQPKATTSPAASTTRRQYTKEQIINCINHLNMSQRDHCDRVTMAYILKNENREDGFELWMEFTKRLPGYADHSDEYYADEWERNIKINPNKKEQVTLNKLFEWLKDDVGEEMANQLRYPKKVFGKERIDFLDRTYDWNDFINEIVNDDNVVIDNYIQKLQRVLAYIEAGANSKVILKLNNENESFQNQKATKFLNSCHHEYHVQQRTAKGEIKNKKIPLKNLLKENLLHCYYKEIVFIPFSPLEERPEKEWQFNLYSGVKVKYTPEIKTEELEAICKPILNHIYEIWVDKNVKGYEFVINWFAHLFQKPNSIPGVSMVFLSEQGAGKNIILDPIMKWLYGDQHSLYASSSELITGKFNSSLEGKLLICCDEMKSENGKYNQNSSMTKVITTSKKVNIERKGHDPFTVANRVRLVYFSNEDSALKIEPGDRRTTVFRCSSRLCDITVPENRLYLEWLGDLLEKTDVTVTAFYNYLLRRDISKFNPNFDKVDTLEKKLIIQTQTQSPIAFIEEFDWVIQVQSETRVISKSVEKEGLSSNQLYEEYKKWCDTNHYTPKKKHGNGQFDRSIQKYVDVEFRKRGGNIYRKKVQN